MSSQDNNDKTELNNKEAFLYESHTIDEYRKMRDALSEKKFRSANSNQQKTKLVAQYDKLINEFVAAQNYFEDLFEKVSGLVLMKQEIMNSFYQNIIDHYDNTRMVPKEFLFHRENLYQINDEARKFIKNLFEGTGGRFDKYEYTMIEEVPPCSNFAEDVDLIEEDLHHFLSYKKENDVGIKVGYATCVSRFTKTKIRDQYIVLCKRYLKFHRFHSPNNTDVQLAQRFKSSFDQFYPLSKSFFEDVKTYESGNDNFQEKMKIKDEIEKLSNELNKPTPVPPSVSNSKNNRKKTPSAPKEKPKAKTPNKWAVPLPIDVITGTKKLETPSSSTD